MSVAVKTYSRGHLPKILSQPISVDFTPQNATAIEDVVLLHSALSLLFVGVSSGLVIFKRPAAATMFPKVIGSLKDNEFQRTNQTT